MNAGRIAPKGTGVRAPGTIVESKRLPPFIKKFPFTSALADATIPEIDVGTYLNTLVYETDTNVNVQLL